MSGRFCAIVCWLAWAPFVHAEKSDRWLRLRTPHFELLTHASERDGAGMLAHLEQLRHFFLSQAPLPEGSDEAAVRIIAFGSAVEYLPYRLRTAADAYFVGSPARDYIVMSLSGPEDFRTAAHEYAHVIAHHRGLHLPDWLSEGLPEVFSTVRFRSGQAIVGGPNAGHVRALARASWIPLEELLAGRGPDSAGRNIMFYAESWALTHMLMFSPAYSPRFGALIDRLTGGQLAAPALSDVYGASLGDVEHHLHAWVSRRLPTVAQDQAAPAQEAPVSSELIASTDVRLALADLQLVIGQRKQAREAYLRLASELPANPDIQAALGRVALAESQPIEARERFRRAVTLGLRNPRVCYEFAKLAEDGGLGNAEVISALELAVSLDPGFDDARFSLALAHMNTGNFAAALRHFEAMRLVPQKRAFGYYTALAHTQLELGMRGAADRSAAQARQYAQTSEEATHAGELAWMARSEIVVQLSANGPGRLRRIPLERGAAQDWNPFIEPGDHVERQDGELREVDCSSPEMRVTVLAADKQLILSVPNPGRVQVRQAEGGIFEFTCGKQEGQRVRVEYAAAPANAGIAGTLRGIQILP